MFYHKRNIVNPTYNTEWVYLKDMIRDTKLVMFSVEWSLQSIERNGTNEPVYKWTCAKTGNSMSFRIVHGKVYAVIINAKTMDVEYKDDVPESFGFRKRSNYYGRDFVKSTFEGVIKGRPYQVGDFIDSNARMKVIMTTKNYMVVHDNLTDCGIMFNKNDSQQLSRYGIQYIGDDNLHKYNITY